MKKSVVAMLTGALVVGATSTTFAAANPFSDVPAGHWSYNAVTRLASEGIIEGYGDNTYRGDRNITRYEMAQMIARALAKTPTANMSSSSRGDLDKLAAEFRDELDTLGVRVAELEEHSDMVKWTGEVRYRYWNDKYGNTKKTNNQLQIRLFPTAEVNEHWTAKARFTASDNMRTDSTGDLGLTYIYAEGKYDNFTVNLGRMPFYTNADQGLIADDFFSGAQLTFGDNFKFVLNGGRWGNRSTSNSVNPDYTIDGKKYQVANKNQFGIGDKADYFGGEILYNSGSRLNLGVGYHQFKDFNPSHSYGDNDKANIWAVGAGYKLSDAIKLTGAYAQNTKADNYDKGYNLELNYAGANRNKPGSWGAFAAYRYVGGNVGFAPTYDPFSQRANKKGFELGATYSPLKNTLTKVSYFHGKTLDNDKTDKTFFVRASVFF